MRVLIMDMTHGGDILAEEFLKNGDSVLCADVYGIAPQSLKEELEKKGASVCGPVPKDRYDLKVAPAHCPDALANGSEWDRSMTFHEAVGKFIADRRFRIEVTGVKGKTSTCYLLAHVLDAAGLDVFLHTSRGQGMYRNGSHTIDRRMSIAPTSMLRFPAGDFTAIAECSLGGSGKADIAAITNLAEDYGIAKNTRRASDSKASIFSDGVNIVPNGEIGIWSKYGHALRGCGGRITVTRKASLGGSVGISAEYGGRRENADLDASYLSIQYLESMELVLEICEEMRIPAETVMRALSTFKGVPGRGEIVFADGRTTIRERNPGISHLSVARTLECVREMGALDGAIAVLDPVNRKVCDKMDADAIRSAASGFGIDLIITDGKGGRPDIPADRKTVIEFIKEGFQ
ncbi:MAG: coenzyme F430 synthase [Candidatus Methanoplasma sp.]|jgi:hypothetical protein|nr:coenzyme F430 synthase [Candidatus Methanoplasma sp.]